MTQGVDAGDDGLLLPEIIGYCVIFLLCLVIMLFVYNEQTYRSIPQLHIVITCIIVFTLLSVHITISLYFTIPSHEGIPGDQRIQVSESS